MSAAQKQRWNKVKNGQSPTSSVPVPVMPPPDDEGDDIDAYQLRELALYGARQKLSTLDLERAWLQEFIKNGGKR